MFSAYVNNKLSACLGQIAGGVVSLSYDII